MSAHLSQIVLKRLALLALGVGLNAESSVAGLAGIPEDVLQYLLSSGELEEMDVKGRSRVIRLLARDARASVRIQALERALLHEDPPSPEMMVALESLATDSDPRVRACFHEHVAEVFDHLSILERTRLVASWASSDDPHLRLAVARALQSPFLALGVPTAVQLLIEDSVDEVRRQGVLAASSRGLAVDP